jgi:hypothetical protein
MTEMKTENTKFVVKFFLARQTCGFPDIAIATTTKIIFHDMKT